MNSKNAKSKNNYKHYTALHFKARFIQIMPTIYSGVIYCGEDAASTNMSQEISPPTSTLSTNFPSPASIKFPDTQKGKILEDDYGFFFGEKVTKIS
jgi:hypothetical protein